jgi:hypothetical protein
VGFVALYNHRRFAVGYMKLWKANGTDHEALPAEQHS